MAYPSLVNVTPNEATYLTSPLPNAWAFDQTFSVNSTAGWFEVDASGVLTTIPLGQSGPFVIKIGAEQVLCSELVEATVSVYQDTSVNGRGYNTTSIVSHPLGQTGNTNVTLIATSAQAISEGNAVSSVFGRTGTVTAGAADYLAVAHGGLTGAVSATRFVGATASGAPATGTFAAGDYVTTLDGHIFICTVAGTSGTWVDVAAGDLVLATTVSGPPAYGASAAAGSAATASKGDHIHGLPAAPADLPLAGGTLTGDATFSAATHGPVLVDLTDGHTYRIVSTAGVLSTVQVS